MNVPSPPENAPARHHYQRELLFNQVWQGANFLSKAGFLILLTPFMIQKWGAEGYGLFALASSLLVSMALLDGGVRALTRIRLAEALKAGDTLAFRRAYWAGLTTFGLVATVAFLVAVGINHLGWIESVLRLSPGGGRVMVVTVALTGVYMLTTLVLEPIAARGNLSMVKAVNTLGAVAALPLCGAALWVGAPVFPTVVLFSLCSILPNLLPLFREDLRSWRPPPGFRLMDGRVVFSTLREGVWFYLTTVALIVKGHALTFLVAALAGPETAGLFYILLRVTEIIGTVGATASDTSLASLARAETPEERAATFRQSWRYTGLFCLHGAVGLSILGEPLLRLWMRGGEGIPSGAGVAMAVFGLASAFSRVVVNAAMGLHVVRFAARANLAEAAMAVVASYAGFRLFGLPGVFWGGSLGVIFLLGPAWRVSRLCGQSVFATYGKPWKVLLPGLIVCALLQGGAWGTGNLWAYFAATGLSGLVVLWQLRQIHRESDASSHCC